MSGAAGRRAVFVDRDGTLTREGDWIRDPADLELLPGAGRALARLREAGFLTVLYSNQSAVARGFVTESLLAAIHDRLRALLAAEGGRLDAIYWCPHHPTEGVGPYRVDCECRKPKPGLVLRAARELDVDLARSWCVGDMERDLAAGAAAGVPGILVATGKGEAEFGAMRAAGRAPAAFVPDVSAAVTHILGDAPSVL